MKEIEMKESKLGVHCRLVFLEMGKVNQTEAGGLESITFLRSSFKLFDRELKSLDVAGKANDKALSFLPQKSIP
jgi:hypothetical protein